MAYESEYIKYVESCKKQRIYPVAYDIWVMRNKKQVNMKA